MDRSAAGHLLISSLFDGCLKTGTGSLVGLQFPLAYGASTNV